ncbi:MAG: SIR2 family protein [Candidatus Nitrosocosmicus sp.]
MYPKTLLSDMLKKINPSDFSSSFRNTSPYDVLSNLDLPLYITTNYDRFMESALSKNSRKKPESDFCKWSDNLKKFLKTANITSVFDDAQYKFTEERPLVYHIHGDIETPESMILTERDYFEFVINMNKGDDKDILPASIRTELATSSLIFIGYSLEDINFRAIFQGFLSFLSSLDRKYRKLSIAIQIVPNNYNKKDIKMQKYLEQYTRNMFDVKVFWGNTSDFMTELEKRWKDFKKNNDMNICLSLK